MIKVKALKTFRCLADGKFLKKDTETNLSNEYMAKYYQGLRLVDILCDCENSRENSSQDAGDHGGSGNSESTEPHKVEAEPENEPENELESPVNLCEDFPLPYSQDGFAVNRKYIHRTGDETVSTTESKVHLLYQGTYNGVSYPQTTFNTIEHKGMEYTRHLHKAIRVKEDCSGFEIIELISVHREEVGEVEPWNTKL